MYVCMYVCLSITGLRLKYTGLRIVYILLARAAQDAMCNGVEIEVQMYGRRLTVQQKDER